MIPVKINAMMERYLILALSLPKTFAYSAEVLDEEMLYIKKHKYKHIIIKSIRGCSISGIISLILLHWFGFQKQLSSRVVPYQKRLE